MKNVKNYMEECFGITSNDGRRTKLRTMALCDVIMSMCDVFFSFSIKGGADGVKRAYELVKKAKAKHIFVYDDEEGVDKTYLWILGDRMGYVNVDESVLSVGMDNVPEYVYVNPPSMTVNEQVTRVRNGELIMRVDENGKIFHSVYDK